MELFIFEKGKFKDVKYICDECSEQVTEKQGLWVARGNSICIECFKQLQKEERKIIKMENINE